MFIYQNSNQCLGFATCENTHVNITAACKIIKICKLFYDCKKLTCLVYYVCSTNVSRSTCECLYINILWMIKVKTIVTFFYSMMYVNLCMRIVLISLHFPLLFNFFINLKQSQSLWLLQFSCKQYLFFVFNVSKFVCSIFQEFTFPLAVAYLLFECKMRESWNLSTNIQIKSFISYSARRQSSF